MSEIVAIRLAPSDDGSHEHVVLIGYASDHLLTGEDRTPEPVMIEPARVPTKKALGESFTARVDGEQAEIVLGSCPLCGQEPYPRTAADSDRTEHLKALPRA